MNHPFVLPDLVRNHRTVPTNSRFHPRPPFLNRDRWFIGPALLLAGILFAIATTACALVIIPVWDSSITSDPNAATITNTINMAIQFYEARFADPITVSIEFEETNSGLGEQFFYYYTITYSEFITSLHHDATTTNDTYALAHLPYGLSNMVPGDLTNPVTGSPTIEVHTANLKAIGITGYTSQLPGGVDGIVSLNTAMMNLTRTSIDPSKFDLLSVAEHEIDEVLGLGSGLQPAYGPSPLPFPQDLFRYNSAGARSFTTSGDDAWFSLDGTNLLVQFNQQSDGDYGDWHTSSTPRVQDAFGTPGATPNMGVELIALDVQGYDLLPPPQPGIVSIALSGTNLVVAGTNGLATGTYYLLASTNMALALNQWPRVATNFMTNNGDFTFTATNAVNPQSAQQFYILQLQ